MPFLYRNLTLSLDEEESLLPEKLCVRIGVQREKLTRFSIVRKGVDARCKGRIKLVYSVSFCLNDEDSLKRDRLTDPDLEWLEEKGPPEYSQISTERKIMIAGMGPAGLFAALRMTEYGLSPLVVERGKPIEERVHDVQAFWGQGRLDPESNVQFGEGGAGAFSDGKLTTRVRDLNIDYILGTLVRFGAPREILYLAKPHIGTDLLRRVVANIRSHLESKGVEIRFRTRLVDISMVGGRLKGVLLDGSEENQCDFLVLAPGHSARDTYAMLHDRSICLEQKPFAVGLRVEHPQELINSIQYGFRRHDKLPQADYALAWNNSSTGRSAYSFCMCPGGEIIAGSSEEGGVVTNGMSLHLRNSPFANSALVVNVKNSDFNGESPLAGVEFQRMLERKAFSIGGGDYSAPVQNLMAFLGETRGGGVRTTYRPGFREADLSDLLPEFVTETLREGLKHFNRKMQGFVTREANLVGVESRTSAPVRIIRGADLESVSLKGLFPAGEGAGYAGGIMSAALDGVRVADRIAQQLMT